MLDSSAPSTMYLEREHGLRLLPFQYEQLLLDMVYLGDVERLQVAFKLVEGSDFYLDKLSGNDAEQRFITAIATITLLTRTAIMAGVDEDRAFRYGNARIRGLDVSGSEEAFHADMFALITCFAELVRTARQEGVSPLVRRALGVIDRSLHRRLAIADIAREVGVSREHLATVFKRETGSTVMAYVDREKVQQAKLHLLDAGVSVGEVADLFGFSSEGQFIRTFKRVAGITPGAWRRGERPPIEQALRS